MSQPVAANPLEEILGELRKLRQEQESLAPGGIEAKLGRVEAKLDSFSSELREDWRQTHATLDFIASVVD